MPRGVGRPVDRITRLGDVSKPQRPNKAGSYRTAERGGGPGQAGGTVYPTILEAYNRDSDYKRWRAGWDYWQGSGKSWADREESYLLRSLRDYGALPGPQLVVVTYFPSDSSPDAAWTVVNRRRGAIILPQPLRAQDIALDTSHAQAERHRLILDVSSTLSPSQLGAWSAFIGDQFEDSAVSTAVPQGVIPEPIDTIAYTLVEVDAAQGKLLFDLSRPFMRRRPDPRKPRAFWQRILYDRRLPLSWRNDGSRYLCSSHRFYCSCPDCSGSRIAAFGGEAASSQELFPRPGAGRSVDGRWESQAVGYSSRFRDLPPRSDQRRECKHIHAVRWSVGYPFYEPSDYEIGGGEERGFQGSGGPESLASGEVFRYHRQRGLTLDRLGHALAESSRVLIDARDVVPDNEEIPAGDRPPVLWTSDREPASLRARLDDWWLQRGTSVLRVFDPAAGRFVDTVDVGGTRRPFLEAVPPQSPIPVEVP